MSSKESAMNKKLPQHVAIIPDGNRRWARSQGKPVISGHERAINKTFPDLVNRGLELGIPYMTFWFFSTENWQRSPEEVQGLMTLFRTQLALRIDELAKKDVRFKVIGRLEDFDDDIQKKMRELIERTKDKKKMTLTWALSYGGRDEILRAVNKIWQKRGEKSAPCEISLAELEANLDTVGLPDPDLIIRTSNEQRLSGFMPWQSVYSEFYFAQKNFPEFSVVDFNEALTDYSNRGRRFGK